MTKNNIEKTLEDISRKLDVLLSLTLRNLAGDKDFGTKDRRRRGAGDLANYFADFGLDVRDIAKILGSPVQSIRTLLTPKRRKK